MGELNMERLTILLIATVVIFLMLMTNKDK